ncbi:MAG TPA: PQQ-binding-like beta-propeller repeat protein [Dokdonella sp.]
MPCRITIRAVSSIGSLALLASAHAAEWPQFGYDAAHSGNNTSETTLGAANVAQAVALYATPVILPAKVDGAPVYASNVATANGVRNLLFLFGSDSVSDFSSTHGTLLAVDAATGDVVWSKASSGSPGNSTQHASASPVVDAAKQYVYSFGVDGFVHKYQIGNGSEVLTPGPVGWPRAITLKPDVEKAASSLTVFGSGGSEYLHAVTDGYIGDGGDYQGHSVAINLASGTQNVFNTLCSDVTVLLGDGGCANTQSGIWGRGGSTYDVATDRVYLATGNGNFDANTSGGLNWGDSVLALAADGSGAGNGLPLDSYTPTNFQQLDDQDIDLGSTSLALLPVPAGSTVQHLGMEVGKDFELRLIDLDDMSGTGAPAHVGGELQMLSVPQGGSGMREQPSVWVDPSDGSTWLFVSNRFGISGVQLGLDGSNQPMLTARWTVTDSSTSTLVANNVLYNAGACSGGTCVIARDPSTGSVLWTSPLIGPIHWQSPIVVDGAIYVTDKNGQLWKFGLGAQADVIFEDGFDG